MLVPDGLGAAGSSTAGGGGVKGMGGSRGMKGETDPESEEAGRDPIKEEDDGICAALRKSRTSFDKFSKVETSASILKSFASCACPRCIS